MLVGRRHNASSPPGFVEPYTTPCVDPELRFSLVERRSFEETLW